MGDPLHGIAALAERARPAGGTQGGVHVALQKRQLRRRRRPEPDDARAPEPSALDEAERDGTVHSGDRAGDVDHARQFAVGDPRRPEAEVRPMRRLGGQLYARSTDDLADGQDRRVGRRIEGRAHDGGDLSRH